MGIHCIGIEVLNIGKMIAEVKCNLGINIGNLWDAIIELFEYIDRTLFKQDFKNEGIELREKIRKNTADSSAYKKIEPHLGKILFLKKALERIEHDEIKKFLLILLSQQIVECSEKNRTWDIVGSFKTKSFKEIVLK